MKKQQAQQILEAISTSDYDTLNFLNIRAYGNSGRLHTRTACITNLDELKGQCNPRLAFNACAPEDIGCPECLKALEDIAYA